MKAHFDILQITRNNLIGTIDGLSDEQLNLIPPNFNNNIIWNMGHVIATQELLMYKLSGLPCNESNEFIQQYRKGSAPEKTVSKGEILRIKALLPTSFLKAQQDYDAGLFKKYNEYTTSFNITLSSIEDAIIFNNVHEGLHLGTVMALRKLVG